MEKILVLGNERNNKLAIMELKRGMVEVVGEIRVNNNLVTNLVPVVELNENLCDVVNGVDTILIMDEIDIIDILEVLHKNNIPMEKITPFSFVVDEEV